MKLLLSDGTAVAVEGYQKTSATVNGNTVDAVLFSVVNSTLEKVKTLFNGGDNLAVLHVYTDDNILKDTFNGYEHRVSIALGDTDTSFEVVVAKTSEVNEKISALDKEIEGVKTSIESINKAVAATSESVNAILKTVETINKAVTDQAKTISTITESINTVTESTSSATLKADNAELAVSRMNEKIASVLETVQTFSNSMNNIVEAVNSANQASGQAVNATDRMNAEFIARLEQFDSFLNLVQEIKELATGNDTKVLTQTEAVRVLTETSNAAKLAVEKFSEDLTTVQKKASDATNAAELFQTKLDNVKENVTNLGQNIENAINESKTATEAVSKVADRVTALEPITDITTLPLDEAKKYRVLESQKLLADWLSTHPITSTCHGGEEAQYSITSEKQLYLQAMITMTETAQKNGVEYQPSWNAVGEACTYDWTLEELYKLGMEIEATVRPLISHQQALEKEILAALTMSQLTAISISYEGIEPNEITIKTE